jgi:hypothetical protein
LEEERIKYLQLEQEYQSLLAHVHLLQQTHKREVGDLERGFGEELRSVKNKLVETEDEGKRLRVDLEGVIRRLEVERKERGDDAGRWEEQVRKLKKLYMESEAQCLEKV